MSSSSTFTRKPIGAPTSGLSDQTRALANRLSEHMGLNAAIEISTENQWHGIVSALMEMKQRRGK